MTESRQENVHEQVIQQVRQWHEVELTLTIPNADVGDYRVSGLVVDVNESGVLIGSPIPSNLTRRFWVFWHAVALVRSIGEEESSFDDTVVREEGGDEIERLREEHAALLDMVDRFAYEGKHWAAPEEGTTAYMTRLIPQARALLEELQGEEESEAEADE